MKSRALVEWNDAEGIPLLEFIFRVVKANTGANLNVANDIEIPAID